MAQTTGLICDNPDCGKAILVGQPYVSLSVQQFEAQTTETAVIPPTTRLDFHSEHVPPAMEEEYNRVIAAQVGAGTETPPEG